MANHEERKAELDKLNDEELGGSHPLIKKWLGTVLIPGISWGHNWPRERKIERLLEIADGASGVQFDRFFDLSTDKEASTREAAKSSRKTQRLGAATVIVAIFAMLWQGWATQQQVQQQRHEFSESQALSREQLAETQSQFAKSQAQFEKQFAETQAQFKRQDARLERERRTHLIEILYETTKAEDGTTVAKHDARTRTEAALEFIQMERAKHARFKKGEEDKAIVLKEYTYIINFQHARLEDTRLDGIDLRDVNFQSAKLMGTYFINAELHKTNFIGSEVTGAKFRGADLREADFTGVTTRPETIEAANVWGLKDKKSDDFKSWAIGRDACDAVNHKAWLATRDSRSCPP